MKHEAKLTYWNPLFPTIELPALHGSMKRQLIADGYRTIEKLDRCPKERLLEFGYSDKMIGHIRSAMNEHRRFVEDIAAIFTSEGLNAKQVKTLWPFDLLRLPFTIRQLGYILLWQRDVGGRYGEKEMFCVVGGRVYYCTECPYRDERSNYCGWCTRKLLDDMAEKKRGAAP